MTDIIERLDNINICMCDYMTRDSSSDCETVDDAKDTITRLRAENDGLKVALFDWEEESKKWFATAQVVFDLRADNERLRAALEEIANGPRDVEKTYPELLAEVRCEARAAITAHPAAPGGGDE